MTPASLSYLPGLSEADKKLQLARISYRDYLLKVAKVDPALLWFFARATEGWYCAGPDAVPALFAWNDGLPGFDGLGRAASATRHAGKVPARRPTRRDNAWQAVAAKSTSPTAIPGGLRLLVRSLYSRGRSGEHDGGSSVQRRVDYSLLDEQNQPARIPFRGSTVVQVEHDGDPVRAREVKLVWRSRREARIASGDAPASWPAGTCSSPTSCRHSQRAQKEALSFPST